MKVEGIDLNREPDIIEPRIRPRDVPSLLIEQRRIPGRFGQIRGAEQLESAQFGDGTQVHSERPENFPGEAGTPAAAQFHFGHEIVRMAASPMLDSFDQ
ncbi:hypothetical protein IQ251_15095 [Saccharopolyspora sp. HNM0983]|uniref:Uncharacterized protein n=1 Tax=Saccharopolyspora montiporae TaxID=2781240 RepID=A0A929BCY9_9PSEU|nr:hypothetical protein [Saccharopolyspora sp. HNM0983]MBE9375778.1 hypothetical protein [Saccharopolyspora sp. HNM0983]